MHSRDATVLIDLLWFNVVHHSSLFQYLFLIYHGPYYWYVNTVSEMQETFFCCKIASLLSIKICVYLIDNSNIETWSSRVKMNVGEDEKQLIKFAWLNYDWWTHAYCIKTIAPRAPGYIICWLKVNYPRHFVADYPQRTFSLRWCLLISASSKSNCISG